MTVTSPSPTVTSARSGARVLRLPTTRRRSDASTRALITTFRTSTDEAERHDALEEVTTAHMPLARSLAHRYAGRGLDREDLEQVAFLALLKAIYRFDLDKPTEFGAYATPTITGELRRHFRDRGWLVRPPRELQERRQLVAQARDRLEQKVGHAPAVAELAIDLGLTENAVREAQVASSNLRPASLDARTADGDRPVIDLPDVHGDDPDLDNGILLRAAIDRLSPRDRRLVSLRFSADLTQAEIGEDMGLSAMQVSRLLRRVLGDLRRDLGADGITARSS
ncbi:sigma-70 family RNA polymerase sigma factor [Terracoccus luteus]|uniref:RNA polymerase sigma-B factor n=1 Tax=Terracoccus luteus TaxID=53356 RepID=A0A839PWS3_9MICO|nr:sigma-70 family RNA polymerase sigma factor [Terracoccus luteus]MBB2986475.1 RNA polymerase sigma-B factor [Terracoccus luteus]MCP2171936.1 RNA polymerase sigma-B factor [Terracoccus luteus]